MRSGYLAGNIAVNAILNNDVTQEGLWDYNINYLNEYGNFQASLDVFRIFLQSCNDNDLNFIFKHLVTTSTIKRLDEDNKMYFTVSELCKMTVKGLFKIRLLLKIRKTMKNMKRVSNHYKNYPQPSGFEAWRKELVLIYDDVYKQ